MDKLTHRQHKSIVLFAAIVATIGTLTVANYLLSNLPQRPTSTNVLNLEAPGCVTQKPDGESVKAALEGGNTFVPKGTLFSGQCFKHKDQD